MCAAVSLQSMIVFIRRPPAISWPMTPVAINHSEGKENPMSNHCALKMSL